MQTRSFAPWVALGAFALSAAAFAQNDLRVNLLGSPLASPEANGQFRAFAKELGAAFTSTNLMPPESLGHSAWAMTVELGTVHMNAVTPVDANGDKIPDNPLRADGTDFYLPTQRVYTDPGTPNAFGTVLIPSVHLRKGFPFSFEVGTRIAWMEKSSIFAGTFEVKWAVNEGFAYLPDIGLRLHATKIFNTRDFDVGAGGFDVGVGKQIAIGGMITLTPYGGWNLVFVGAGTRKPIDFSPEQSYAQSVSSIGAQLQTAAAYDDVSPFDTPHNRFYAGLRFIGGVVQLAGEVSYSALGTVGVKTGSGVEAIRPLPPVIGYSVTLGLDY